MDKSKWTYKKLGELSRFERGLTYSKSDEGFDSGVYVMRSNNIDLNSYTLNFSDLKSLRKDFIIPENKKLKKDTIFICMSNGSREHLGKIAFVDKDYDLAFGGFMGLIIPQTTIYPKFLYYGLRSEEYKKFLSSIGNGANIRNLKFSNLSNYKVPVPPYKVQELIVSELDQLSELISLKQQQLKEYDALAQSLFYEMFGDIKGKEKGYPTATFGECFKLKSGTGLTAKDFIKGAYPVYGGNGIAGYHNEYNLEGTNIIIGRVGALCGNVHLVGGKIFATDNAFILTDNKGFDTVYLRQLLSMLNLRGYAREAMQPVISNKTLKDITIPLPPLSLQHSFASKVRAIESQKSLVKQSMAETQTLLDSRMQEYFG